MGDGGLWLALAGERIPTGATLLASRDAMFWLRQSVPPMAHPTLLHAISEIADALGYSFHGAAPFADEPWVMETLEQALAARTLVAFRLADVQGGGKGPAPQPQPRPQPKPQPTLVNPVVEPVSLVLLVKKLAKNPVGGKQEPYTHPKRQAVTLKADAAFDGTATFSCDKPDKVKFFSAAKDGTEIKFDGTANVFKPNAAPAWAPKGASISSGVTVFAEGAAPSGAMDDITVKLALSGGSHPTGPDDTATITSVEVTLDIHTSKPDAKSAAAFSKDDKVHVGRSLLVQDKGGNRHRAKLVIQQVKPAAFKGQLVLKAASAHVDAFKNEKVTAGEATALPFKIAADKVAAAGEVLWAQGSTASDKMRDTGFILGIDGVDDEGDKVMATSVLLNLDICMSRTKAQAAQKPPADPSPMPEADEVTIGRFVHEQDAGNHHGRALLLVCAVKPKNFDGTVVLESLGASTQLFPNEKPTGGEAATATPREFDYKKEKNELKKLWVQGKTVSGAVRDSGYLLHLKDDPKANADTVLLTVVKFSEIKATIKATPATPPNPNYVPAPLPYPTFPAVIDHEFKTTKADEDFVANPPLPLVRNAQPDIKLELKAAPAGLTISWDAVRNPKDHEKLGKAKDKPTLTPNAAKLTECNLNADNKGSFRIRPFIDSNGSTEYDEGEPSIPLNLILFDVRVKRDRSLANVTGIDQMDPVSGNRGETISGAGAGVATGLWPGGAIGAADLAAAAMGFDLDADVTGGGADGKLGLTDYLFCGLCNNQWVEHADSDYLDTTVVPNLTPTVKSLYATNFPLHGGRRRFHPGDPAPIGLTMPLLDSGFYPTGTGGLGGDSAVMTTSAPHTVAAAGPAVGERWTIQCVDSPGNGFTRTHPVNAAATLQKLRIDWQFVGNFLFWTELNKTRGSSAGTAKRPADRVYSVVRTQTWAVKGEWTPKFTMPRALTRNSYTATNAGATIHPVGRAQDHNVNVRPPATVRDGILGDDAR